MEKDCYEGACGQIIFTENPNVVIKKVYKKATATRRIKSHRANTQWQIQKWAHQLCKSNQGFQILWVPEAWNPKEHEYTMKRIDVSVQILPSDFQKDSKLVSDLQLLYEEGLRVGWYPCDYELYRQPDGSVAMVDFDKFGYWKSSGSVEFPWGLSWTKEQVNELTPIRLSLTNP
jgi:hypothetical protein